MMATSQFLRSIGISVSVLSCWFLFFASPVSSVHASPVLEWVPTFQQQQFEPLIVGVLDLDPNNVDPGETSAISDRLRLYLGEQGIFRVIERQKMSEIMDEVGFQFTGACDTDECVVQVGKILGARKMVAGSVSQVGTIYTLQVRLVDIETSTIEHNAVSDVAGIEEVLRTATRAVAEELAQKVMSQTGVTQLLRPGAPMVVTTGQIRIETDPAGAEITVDGAQLGIAPRTLALEEGTHELLLVLDGYLTHTDTIAVIGGESRTINISLNEFPSGTLWISTDPVGVTVLVNDEEKGETPQVDFLRLDEGQYKIELKKDGYETATRYVEIRGGRTEELNVELMRSGQAQLSLSSQLRGATVVISSQDQTYTLPTQEIKLRPGEYTVEVKARGYAHWRQIVTLEDGDNQVVPVVLRPKSRVGAGTLSLIIPGSGQFYSRRPVMGALMLLSHGILGYFTYTEFDNYTTIQDEHSNYQRLYDQADTSRDVAMYRQLLLSKADEMHDSRWKLNTMVIVLGGLWALNILDAYVLMPRLPRVGPGIQTSLQAQASGHRLALVLRVAF